MVKKKFNIAQKDHTVSLSQGNMATRRAAPKPPARAPEEVATPVKLGPALQAPAPVEPVMFNPDAAPRVPSIIAAPPVEVPKPVKPARSAKPVKGEKAAPVKTPRPSRAKPAGPTDAGARAAPPAPPAPQPVSAPDPLLKRLPLGTPSRTRIISLRARNAQLRQQLEQLDLSSKTRSRV